MQQKVNSSKKSMSEQVLALAQQVVDFSGVDVEILPPEISQLASRPETFGDPRVLAYTTAKSTIAHILHRNPASDAMLRIVYPDTNGHPLTAGLDRFLSRSLSGQALRDRLTVCSAWLAEHFVKENKTIIDLGGGSGSYAFESLATKSPPSGFRWRVLDLDGESLQFCNDLITVYDFQNVIETRQDNFMSTTSVDEKFDYAVLIGVLCGMDHDTAVKCLSRARDHLKPGGEIYTATLLQRAFDEDPRTFRLLCNIGGWQLRPKHLPKVQQIFQDAGWEITSIMSERENGHGQYAIVHAVMPT